MYGKIHMSPLLAPTSGNGKFVPLKLKLKLTVRYFWIDWRQYSKKKVQEWQKKVLFYYDNILEHLSDVVQQKLSELYIFNLFRIRTINLL